MKHLSIALVLSLMTNVAFSEQEKIREGTEVVDSLSEVQGELKSTGKIDLGCVNCPTSIDADKKVNLDKEEIDLQKPHIYKNNTPYVIHLKRTPRSPEKISLKFENSYRVCGKMFVGTNPVGGAVIVECMVSINEYQENNLDLDLSNFSMGKDEEEQIIELKITKPKADKTAYFLEVSILKGSSAQIKQSKKFWGTGYNILFLEAQSPRDRS